MIAMVVGLVLVAGLVRIFTSNKQNFLVQQALARLQENTRLASIMQSSEIHKVGFLWDATGDPAAVFSGANAALTGTDNNANSADSILDGTDTITIRYQGDGISTDCQGTVVAAGALLTEIYRLNTANEFECNNGSGFQPLIDNVENFQILYGEDTDGDRSTDQYRNAASVIDFDNVLAVHVVLLHVSDRDIKPAAESKQYKLLDTAVTVPPVASPDRLQRRAVERIISLRNRLE
jgi:type IV pilus assembly protein PilW